MAAIDRIMYDLMYQFSTPRWDDGRIPPQVAQLVVEQGKTQAALDLGCGTGTHSVYLAQHGLNVTGIDVSPAAIKRAREKAAQAGISAQFIVHDASRLDFLRGPFDIALDVGCLHALRAADQQRYAMHLTRLVRGGGTVLVWGMDRRSMGFGLTADSVRRIFAPGFDLVRMESDHLHQRLSTWYWMRRK